VIGKLNQSYTYTGVSDGDPLNGGPSTGGGLLEDSLDPAESLATTTLNLIDPTVDPTLGGET
jgi:hypothetical protein